MFMSISVLGAGSWGITLARLLANKGEKVSLWEFAQSDYKSLIQNREHKRFLPGIKIPDSVLITNDLAESVKKATAVLLALPSHTVRSVCQQLVPYISDQMVIINCAKGLETDTNLRISEVITQVIPKQYHRQIAVLSGPSHAEEVSRDIPTTVAISGFDIGTMKSVQSLMITPRFRVYTNPDLIGVEIGGALKNIIAIGAGISDGLGFGDNTKAGLITRGLAEISRLGIKLGAEPLTFSGLTGLGDLVVTCTSRHSRNRAFGEKIAKKDTVQQALDEIGMVVEGVRTTQAAEHLAQKFQVEMPITDQIYQVIYQNKPPLKAVNDLMLRDAKPEMERIK
ncbi:MAG: NAD(P)H-dependent glycerol-3-phosphate dehydrogenase [bacterium]|nr:NAD(P)H-dependent glycerol-3-phosphate dehydrogenase [bacterium]